MLVRESLSIFELRDSRFVNLFVGMARVLKS